MKNICFLVALFLTTGCEPSYRLYVKNSTDRNIGLDLIQIKVHGLFPLGTSDTLYANFGQDLIPDIKWSTEKKLNQRKKIEHVNDSTFQIGLNSHSTYLISSGMLIPFKRIIINQEHRIDTIIMYGKDGKDRNVRKSMEQIKVHNKMGFYRAAKIIEVIH